MNKPKNGVAVTLRPGQTSNAKLGDNQSSQQSNLQKRKNLGSLLPNESPLKRLKTDEMKSDPNSTKISMPIHPMNSENKPKKPLSAYIYFS